MSAAKHVHVIAHDATGPHPYRIECLHCGAHHDSVMPIAINMWLAGADQFTKDHARCKPADGGKKP